MNKIKIVHIIGSLSTGGAERFAVDLCNELAKNAFYQVYIISLCKNNSQDVISQDISKQVKCLCFNKKSGFSPSVYIKLTKWFINVKPEIVHTHLNAFEYVLLYSLLSKKSRFFHTLHNMAQHESPKFLPAKYLRTLFYKYGKVKPITISRNGSETYRQHYNLKNDIRIENGRPDLKLSEERERLLNLYKSNSDDFLLVHIGRISEEKNQALLIDVVQKFNRLESKKCKLLIIGTGIDGNLQKRLLKKVKNDPQIEFLGVRKNIGDYLNIADAFCMCSTFEGMPIVLIEALSMGCMPISTPVGGIPQMITHGITGFLSKDISLESYYETLKQALFSPEKAVIQNNCINAFKTYYHIEISAEAYSNVYYSMLNNKNILSMNGNKVEA